MSIGYWIVIGVTLLLSVVMCIGAIGLLISIVRAPAGTSSPRGVSDMTGDEEGYVHSGPYGYSPTTAYPQTQYGSGFNPDAEWAERTGFDRDHRD